MSRILIGPVLAMVLVALMALSGLMPVKFGHAPNCSIWRCSSGQFPSY